MSRTWGEEDASPEQTDPPPARPPLLYLGLTLRLHHQYINRLLLLDNVLQLVSKLDNAGIQ